MLSLPFVFETWQVFELTAEFQVALIETCQVLPKDLFWNVLDFPCLTLIEDTQTGVLPFFAVFEKLIESIPLLLESREFGSCGHDLFGLRFGSCKILSDCLGYLLL